MTAENVALLNSIRLGVIPLLQHPGQLGELIRNPSRAPAVFNELIRYDTTSARNSRRATKADIIIGGKHIPRDIGVICSVQAGVRNKIDPNEPDPETFNIRRIRNAGKVLGFCHEPHRCQGEALLRIELEIAFTVPCGRLTTLRLAKSLGELEYSLAKQNRAARYIRYEEHAVRPSREKRFGQRY